MKKLSYKHIGAIIMAVIFLCAAGLLGVSYFEKHYSAPSVADAPVKPEIKSSPDNKLPEPAVSEEQRPNKDIKDDDYISENEKEKLISRDEAKSKALSHAGVGVGGIREYEIELDRERGVIVYEIEFKSGRYEYSYEINAESGEIVKGEKEFDD